MAWRDEAKKSAKRVRCEVCGHQFEAVFFKKNPNANDVEYCLVCGARNFKFIEFSRNTKKDGREIEKENR